MGDVIVLRSIPIDLNSNTGHQFVVDCVRAAEGLISDSDLQSKYELSPVDWRNITKDTALMRAIQAERERRVLSGTAAREAAAQHFIKAPAVLGSIMSDTYASPRHRIEAAKEIRQVAAGSSSADSRAGGEKFLITINLGEDCVVHHEFDVTPKPKQLEDEPDVDE
jgi:hypothetical protein